MILAYLRIYKITIISPTISPPSLQKIPVVKSTPAAFDAITAENGLTVENIHPIVDPIYMEVTQTSASYLLQLIITGQGRQVGINT
jgi:hypothetical protein